MGLILDTGVLIASERRGEAIEDILRQARDVHGEIDIALSGVSVVLAATPPGQELLSYLIDLLRAGRGDRVVPGPRERPEHLPGLQGPLL
ncbi:MAG: hypothetical protein WBW33_28355 [Bryobacteraceae bacterium]